MSDEKRVHELAKRLLRLDRRAPADREGWRLALAEFEAATSPELLSCDGYIDLVDLEGDIDFEIFEGATSPELLSCDGYIDLVDLEGDIDFEIEEYTLPLKDAG